MTIDVKPSRDQMTWLLGHTYPARVASRNFKSKLVWLPVLVIVGSMTWIMLSGPSDAESQAVPVRSPVLLPAQDASWFNPAITRVEATTPAAPAEATLVTPAESAAPAEAAAPEAAAVEISPLDGLKISSQSWRRGGLGSKALVTFTLRNGNDFAVKDIGLFCSFVRRDGSHLTDRTRVIHDTVNMKSRKTFARLHIGFININADKAKCSLVAASRI
jgi:hypothetical protein